MNLMIFLVSLVTQEVDAPILSNVGTDEVQEHKEVIYQKETTIDLSGSSVQVENQAPSAFLLSKMQTPKAEGLLAERLNFTLRNYNDLGF